MHPPSAFGTFRVLHQIGSGVLGPVFRAHDSHRQQLVAIKAFKLDVVPEQALVVADALRGIVARPVDDPSIVRPVDAGVESGIPYLVLEYASGDALDVLMREGRVLTGERAIAMLGALAHAIDEAWDIGVGHGALHPRDIFVAGASGLLVTGFGVVQALETAGIRPQVRRLYSAPERVAGAAWNIAADIYSLGVIARESLAATRVPATPDVRQVLEQATADAPAGRFSSAKAFVEALSGAIDLLPLPHAAVAAPAAPEPAIEVAPPDPVGDAPLRPAVQVTSAPRAFTLLEDEPAALPEPVGIMVGEQARPPFPWAAVIAVGLAGLAVGAVGGFRFGLSRGGGIVVENRDRGPIPPTPSSDPDLATVISAPSPTAPVAETPLPEHVVVTRTAAEAGSLQVDSRPRGARVSLDGRRLGETPLRIGALSPGDHRVLLELLGHRRVSSTVKVLAGEVSRFAVSLEQTEVPKEILRPRRPASQRNER